MIIESELLTEFDRLIREKDAELPAIARLSRFASVTLQGDQV